MTEQTRRWENITSEVARPLGHGFGEVNPLRSAARPGPVRPGPVPSRPDV
jgi:hypothetical protein